MNTIYRDLSDAENALHIATCLENIAIDNNINEKTASRVWRSIARTYAIYRPGKALGAANRSLKFAERCGQLREIGNAQLALGEAQRHNKNLEQAKVAYDQAIDCARALGNVDSLLWSTLGKADAELLQGNVDDAKSTLHKIEPFFSEQGRRHPLEALHWEFSMAELAHLAKRDSGIDIGKLLDAYEGIGISWPAQYYSQMQANGKLAPKPL